MNALISILPFAIVVFHFVDKWYLSIGRLWVVYVITILGSITTVLFNVLLYAYQDCTKSILVFSITSAWSIIMAVRGINRLVKAKRYRVQRQDNIQFNREWSW
jgi:hypothetical protein